MVIYAANNVIFWDSAHCSQPQIRLVPQLFSINSLASQTRKFPTSYLLFTQRKSPRPSQISERAPGSIKITRPLALAPKFRRNRGISACWSLRAARSCTRPRATGTAVSAGSRNASTRRQSPRKGPRVSRRISKLRPARTAARATSTSASVLICPSTGTTSRMSWITRGRKVGGSLGCLRRLDWWWTCRWGDGALLPALESDPLALGWVFGASMDCGVWIREFCLIFRFLWTFLKFECTERRKNIFRPFSILCSFVNPLIHYD